MFFRTCIGAAGLLAIVGCGGTPHSDLTQAQVQGVPNGTWTTSKSERHALSGAWISECLQVGRASKRIEARIFDERTLILVFYFSDLKCKQMDFEQGIAIQAQPERTSEDGWVLNAQASRIHDGFLVAHSEDSSRRMTAARTCQVRSWPLKRAVSILGTECMPRKSLGVYEFERSRDPRFVQIRFPDGGSSAWLWSRL